jgi:hypothetical protein
MKLARTIVMAVAVLAVSAFVYSDTQVVEFISGDAFTVGYNNGYNHGQIDSQIGLNYNFRRNPNFQSGINFYTYRSSEFREGYKQGYQEGFAQPSSKLKVMQITPEQKTTRTIKVIEPEEKSTTRTIRVVEPAEKTTTVRVLRETPTGSARIFADENFDGEEQLLPIGRYPYLEDWKNEIESIQVDPNVRVILFERNNFQGQSIVLDQNVADLGELNFQRRAASMMIVEADQ